MSGATTSGTETFAARAVRNDVAPAHFREACDLTLSTIGLGTYLGATDDATDDAYAEAILEAVGMGCNVLDTASTYRCQRSERVIGRALERLAEAGVDRDELVLATKGGYVAFDGAPPENPKSWIEEHYIARSLFGPDDLARGNHAITPSFIADQLDQSLSNLGVSKIDIYYLHNPEAQLAVRDRDAFRDQLRSAFEFLEGAVAEGKIAFYGTATWNAFRVAAGAKEFMSLEEVVGIAREVAPEDHHFRFLQAPYNLAMTEGLSAQTQSVEGETLSLCQAAQSLGVYMVASASIAQGRLTQGLPDWLGTLFKGFATDAQRCIQFVRSTPGVVTGLVGMKTIDHVRENLAVARVPPAPMEDFLKLFEVDSSD